MSILTKKKKNLNKKTKTISINKNKQNNTKTKKNFGVKTMRGGFLGLKNPFKRQKSKGSNGSSAPNKGAFGQPELTKRPLSPITIISPLEQTMMNVQQFGKRLPEGKNTSEKLQKYENQLRNARNLPKRYKQLPPEENIGFRSIIANRRNNTMYKKKSAYPKINAPPVPAKVSVNNLRKFLLEKSYNNLRN